MVGIYTKQHKQKTGANMGPMYIGLREGSYRSILFSFESKRPACWQVSERLAFPKAGHVKSKIF